MTVQRVSIVSQLVEIIGNRIREEYYPPNSKCPSGEALAQEFNVSRATIRAVINVLATHGMLRKKNGVGVFTAANPRVSNSLNEVTDFYRLIEQSNRQPSVENIKAALSDPSPAIRQALEIEVAEKTVMTWKVFLADESPVIYCENSIAVSTLGESLAKELIDSPEKNDSLFSFLEQECGLSTSHALADINVSRAEECDFPSFDYPDGTPILVIKETGFDANETPIWHSLSLYPENSINFGLLRRR